jgi:hypothetical protein
MLDGHTVPWALELRSPGNVGESEVNDLLLRCENELDRLNKERRLTSDALPLFRELAESLERRLGLTDRRSAPRSSDPQRRRSPA